MGVVVSQTETVEQSQRLAWSNVGVVEVVLATDQAALLNTVEAAVLTEQDTTGGEHHGVQSPQTVHEVL